MSTFAFSYLHERSECRLVSRNVAERVDLHFVVGEAATPPAHADIALTTRVCIPRIVHVESVDVQALAAEMIDDIFSHGEPRRRKPGARDRERLHVALSTWIRLNRRVPGWASASNRCH